MATSNQYHGYCCKCGSEIQAGIGRIRRYSGANKRSAPAGSRSRRTAGYNGINSDSGPGAMGKYAIWCVPCDDADQQSKRDERKLQKLNEKIYKVWNTELYRLGGLKDAASAACCIARDSGDANAWHQACIAQDAAYAAVQAWRTQRPVYLTQLDAAVKS